MRAAVVVQSAAEPQRLLYRPQLRRQLDQVRLRLHRRLRVLQAAPRDDAHHRLTPQARLWRDGKEERRIAIL